MVQYIIPQVPRPTYIDDAVALLDRCAESESIHRYAIHRAETRTLVSFDRLRLYGYCSCAKYTQRLRDAQRLYSQKEDRVALLFEEELSLLSALGRLGEACAILKELIYHRSQEANQHGKESPYGRHAHVPVQRDNVYSVDAEALVANVLAHAISLVDRVVALSKLMHRLSADRIWPDLPKKKSGRHSVDSLIKKFLVEQYGQHEKTLLQLQSWRDKRVHEMHLWVHAEEPPLAIFFTTARFPNHFFEIEKHITFTFDELCNTVSCLRQFMEWWAKSFKDQFEAVEGLPAWEDVSRIIKERKDRGLRDNFSVRRMPSGELEVIED